jgi:lipoprotein NlpD
VRRAAALALVALLAAACAARRPAPVSERATLPPEATVAQPAPAPEPAPPVEKPLPTHTVKKGETLVGIALQYGLDYRELAAWNNIVNPAAIKVGQVLVIAAPASATVATPLAPAGPEGAAPLGPVATPLVTAGPPIEGRPLANTDTVKVEPRAQKLPYSERALAQLSAGDAPLAPEALSVQPGAPTPGIAQPPKAAGTDSENIDWTWPVKGKVLAPFAESSKGIDIAGKKGNAVRAAAAGRVIYADHGLRGLGNLIIIRHSDAWLSAYAHNDKLLVREQDEVKKGQKIAEMGSSDADQVKLHFEVRRQGKPVDPLKLLPPQ